MVDTQQTRGEPQALTPKHLELLARLRTNQGSLKGLDLTRGEKASVSKMEQAGLVSWDPSGAEGAKTMNDWTLRLASSANTG